MTIHAHAKLNLNLHIVGRRADGYHDLETLVVFTDLSDRLEVERSDTLSLKVQGAFAHQCGAENDNLVIKAAQRLQAFSNSQAGARITLQKNIPAGAGLGGGSADAAAALTLLNDHWKLELSVEELGKVAKPLGADVLMCLADKPLVARGTGDVIAPLGTPLPACHAVLVYPNMPLSTAQVYAAYEPPPAARTRCSDAHAHTLSSSPMLFGEMPQRTDGFRDFLTQLSTTRNDLQRPAITLMPKIAEVLLALETVPGASRVVRMSGSGSCCFALVEGKEDVETLASSLFMQYPQWWIRAVTIRS